MKKISKKILIILAMTIFALLLISNVSNATETLTYENLNYHIESTETFDYDTSTYVTVNTVLIDSLVDTTIEELRIPATIDGMKVVAFADSEYVEEGVYKHVLTSAPNLKKLIIEDDTFVFGIHHDFTNTTIEELVIEEMIFERNYTLPYYTYLTNLRTVSGYGYTRLAQVAESAGYTYKSIGENTSLLVCDEYNSNKLDYLNAYVENLVIPEDINWVSFLVRHVTYHSGVSIEEFSKNAANNIKTIKFETKDQIKIYDQGYLNNVETVYGYTGTGAETFAENIGAKFISLGTVEEVSPFTYEIIDDSYIRITGLRRVTPTIVEFPSYIEDLPVEVIAGGTIQEAEFAVFAEVTDIVLPETVKKVESGAFSGMYMQSLKVLSKEIEYLDNFYCIWRGTYILCNSAKVYAYDESGMKEVVTNCLGEDNYYSLNEVVYTTKDTEEVTVDETTVDVMPIDKKTSIEDLLTEENFPVIGTYTVKVLDASGNEKASNAKVGSRNVIQITDESGKLLAEYTVVVPGDVNGDGETKIYDSFQILKDVLVSLGETIDAIEVMIRDYNEDGNVRIYDAFQYLKEAILG